MPRLLCLFLLALLPATSWAQTRLKPEDIPNFTLRARVVSIQGKPPGEKQRIAFSFTTGKSTALLGSAWSDWLTFGPEQAVAILKTYPHIYMRGWPVVLRLSFAGVVDPTRVEAELKFAGEPIKMTGELFGPNLGVMVWKEEGKPHAATMAGYNKRYWKVLEGVSLSEKQRPQHFPIVDRFIGGDDDRLAWREGIEQLSRAGFSVLMLPPSRPVRDLLREAGLRRTAWAVYSPPGYAFDFDPKITPEALTDWADKQAKPYLEAGYERGDMALFALSDEPGWYYPAQFAALQKSPAGLTRFRAYLKEQGLMPADVGSKNWDEVQPLGRSAARDLPSRRLFYWTMRFFAHDSTRHFANSTRALEKAFYPNMPILTNWNFFSGRLYVPGPVANNAAKTSPDAAMGGHDWLEFGRMRGSTMLWTEDWFGDGKAYQWSFYCAKLRCAAENGKVEFGGYVIPRTAGDREDGIVQKILCVAGSGGKAIKYFVFGPEYNFPGNCYSERAQVLPKMAEAHQLIGTAEELLWPGRRPRPEVAIVAPRSAEMWDAKEQTVAKGMSDATNHNLNGSTVDYMAEVADLYLALQHANIPVDFVDEDDLSLDGLKPYKVVYLTEPNVPAEGQRGLAAWVKAGGTLVTVSGAGSHDRYDEPCTILADAIGIREKQRERLLVRDTKALKDESTGDGIHGKFVAVGVKGSVESKEGVLGKFADGSPAVLEREVGKGKAIHFAWLPGLAYWKSATTTRDKLPAGFSESIRRWIVSPVEGAKVELPVKVDQPLVETPLLLSEKGAAVTLLNWSGEPLEKLKVQIRVPFAVKSVESARKARLKFSAEKNGVVVEMPLGAVDVLLVRP